MPTALIVVNNAMIASDGIARPMLTIETASKPPRR
jgi:hypothetical protein